MTVSSDAADEVPSDREIAITRTIDGPRELVFEAFTDVRHLSRWWGPNGFTTTTRAFTFREGGSWDYVMHAPDGSDHPNWVTWREIAPPERIVLTQGMSADDPDAFETIITFTERGETTEITMRSVFRTVELRDRVVREYRAVEGGRQTLDRLARYVIEQERTE